MKSGLIVVLAVLCGVILFATASKPFATQKLTIEHDFGVVLGASELSHEFVVKNVTDTIWEIQTTKASCGCLKVTHSTAPIEPGEAAHITLSLSALGRRGAMTYAGTVYFKHGEALKLVVKADVAAVGSFESVALHPKTAIGTDEFECETSIVLQTTDGDAGVTVIGTQGVSADVEQDWAGVEAQKYVLRVRGRIEPGRSAAYGTVRASVTQDGKTRQHRIEVLARRTTWILVSPSPVLLSRSDTPESVSLSYALDEAHKGAKMRCVVSPRNAGSVVVQDDSILFRPGSERLAASLRISSSDVPNGLPVVVPLFYID